MRIFLSVCFLLIVGVATAQAQSAPVPKLTSPVMDQVGVLTPDVNARLSRVIRDVNARGVAQVQILIINSLEGEPIESYSLRVVDEWLIGDKTKDNGVLILVSVTDRRSRIEVGRGLEGAIPDVMAKRIQSEFMRPRFKSGDYAGGIEAGTAEVIALADKEFPGNAERPTKLNLSKYYPLMQLAFVVFMILFSTIFGGRGRRRRGGFLDAALGGWAGSSTGSWGGGGSSWGGGSSGGWGGGGGGFGGGGASDSW